MARDLLAITAPWVFVVIGLLQTVYVLWGAGPVDRARERLVRWMIGG